MTPEAQKEYIITEEELNWIHNHEAYHRIKSRPYSSAKESSDKVLDDVDHILNEELRDCINRGDEEAVLIGDFICILADKVAELRTKEREGC